MKKTKETRTRLSFKLLWRYLDEYKESKPNASQWTINDFLNFVESEMKSPRPLLVKK